MRRQIGYQAKLWRNSLLNKRDEQLNPVYIQVFEQVLNQFDDKIFDQVFRRVVDQVAKQTYIQVEDPLFWHQIYQQSNSDEH
jgi:hypothetical protein